MIDELVSFETAKLVKEKEFDIATLYSYYEDGTIGSQATYINYNQSNTLISAPTQSLLQRWLREKHAIQIEIEWDTVSYGYKVWHPDTLHKHPDLYNHTYKTFTYEEALEEGLKQALNLIE